MSANQLITSSVASSSKPWPETTDDGQSKAILVKRRKLKHSFT